jgi:hypothetical protein
MEPGGSLPHPQEPATCPFPEQGHGKALQSGGVGGTRAAESESELLRTDSTALGGTARTHRVTTQN